MKRKSKKKRRSSKEGLWQESLSYLKLTRNYIYFVIVLFFVSAFVSFLFPENFSFFEQFLRELVEKIEGLSLLGLILFILQNNVTTLILQYTLSSPNIPSYPLSPPLTKFYRCFTINPSS